MLCRMFALAALQRVRARKWLLVLALLASCALAVALNFRVSLSPIDVSQKQPRFAIADSQLLIDSGRSAIVDSLAQPYLLASRGPLYAALTNSESIKSAISRRTGLEIDEFAISAQTVEGSADSGKVSSLGAGPLVLVRPNSTPILLVQARAPTRQVASQLAEGARDALVAYVRRAGEREGVRLRRRIALRPLGRPKLSTGGEVKSIGDAATAGLAIWLALAALILSVDALFLLARRERSGLALR